MAARTQINTRAGRTGEGRNEGERQTVGRTDRQTGGRRDGEEGRTDGRADEQRETGRNKWRDGGERGGREGEKLENCWPMVQGLSDGSPCEM